MDAGVADFIPCKTKRMGGDGVMLLIPPIGGDMAIDEAGAARAELEKAGHGPVYRGDLRLGSGRASLPG